MARNIVTTLLAVGLLGCGTFAGYVSDERTVGVSVAIGEDTEAPGVEGGTLSQIGADALTGIACTIGNTALGWFGRDPICEPDEVEL